MDHKAAYPPPVVPPKKPAALLALLADGGDGTDPVPAAPTKKAAAAARKVAAAAAAATAQQNSNTDPAPKGPKAPSPAQLTFTTKAGVPMTPTQVLSHLKQLTSNAEKALTAAPGFVKGAKGKGKGAGGKPVDGTVPAKASGSASLTAQNLQTAGLSTTGKKDTPVPSSVGGSTAKSGRTAGGTRTEPAVPRPPYKCHLCQSPKHFSE